MFGLGRKSFVGALATIVFGAFCAIFVPVPADADIPTVGYMHQKIRERWNIDRPISGNGASVFESKLLMSTIDQTNAAINQNDGTSYVLDEKLAMRNIVAIPYMMYAIENLVKPEYKFFFVPATDDNTYTFEITAAGTFYINWDDGEIQTFVKNTVGREAISHTYRDGKPASAHEIKLAGHATRYATTATAAVRFYDGNYYSGTQDGNKYVNPYQLKSMRGCLGCVFSTITDTSVAENARQPRFYGTFSYNTTLTSEIPAELFGGVTGAPVTSMFHDTFLGCANLSGSIPKNLFAGISGSYAGTIFMSTFSGCSSLSGAIPDGLFGDLSGTPAGQMFQTTFSDCTNLTGAIPDRLFGDLSGPPAFAMFNSTFHGCKNLTGSIPKNLFAGISGQYQTYMFKATFSGCDLTGSIPDGFFGDLWGTPANGMFDNTFRGCEKLTGPIPDGLFGRVSGNPAPSMFAGTFQDCAELTGPIPENLFGDIYGTPATSMFANTFSGCSALTGEIPSGLFGNLSGAPAASMFYFTFYGCENLSGQIPSGLFGTISGAPAEKMFSCTFHNCSNLNGPIPDKLFGDVFGPTAEMMFYSTFFGCRGLTGLIPDNLFGDIYGAPAQRMFMNTFAGCTSLTGDSAKVGAPGAQEYLYERWPDTQLSCQTTNANGVCTGYISPSKGCYSNDTQLTDYDCIPENWGGPGTRAPGTCVVDPAEPEEQAE